MSLVKVKTKGQVTIPTTLRKQAGLNIGDFLEAKLERGKITLTPKSIIDSRLEQALEDIRHGRSHGPFTIKEFEKFLDRNKIAKIKNTRKRT
jgi:AbrB family looped-hinge helix DNA binding protein